MKLDRRTFLKSASAGGVYCALSQVVPGTLATLYASPLEPVGQEVMSICEMCSTRCPISARVVDDRNVSINGNIHAAPYGGKVCARGGSGHSLLYDPERLVKPIKRMGERGEGKWKEISWEEAYSEIADKLLAIKKKYGPEAVAFSSKAGSQDRELFYMARAFGSPNVFTHISTCPGGPYVAAASMFGGLPKCDFGNARYIVNFGHSMYEGIEMWEAQAMMKNQVDKGTKLVAFDPRFSILADKADEWYPIKPGTDIAVALAMSHVMIRDDLVDLDFVTKYVEGYESFVKETENYTPEWAEQISGVSAADIVRITHELAFHAPHALVDYGHRSTYTPEEFEFRRALFAVNILLGNIEREGGLFFSQKAKEYNGLAGEKVAPELGTADMQVPAPITQRIDMVADKQYTLLVPYGGVYQSILDTAIKSDPYPLKGWVITRSNPLQTVTDRAKVEKAIRSMDFVVACDVYITETAALADIILPESTYLERDESIYDYSLKFPAYAIRQPVVKTIGDTKPCWQIWRELAIKMGLGEYYKWNDMSEYQLAQLGGDKEELAQLKEKGWLQYGEVPLLLREKKMVADFTKKFSGARTPDADGTYASAMKFRTPNGKIALSSSFVETIAPGREVIRYRDVKMKKEEELFFIQGKVAVHTNGATHNIPMLHNLMSDCSLWIHPETAEKLGIKTGDTIRIHNKIGSEEGKALVTLGIRPDTVFAYMGFGSKNKELKRANNRGIHCGNLLPDVTAPVCGMNLHTTGVTVEKA